MRAGLVLGVGLAGLVATQALAAPHVGESFPEFDTKQFCRTLGGSDCLDGEARARALFKANWRKISPETREACTMRAVQRGGSYVLMKGCILDQASAGQVPALFRP